MLYLTGSYLEVSEGVEGQEGMEVGVEVRVWRDKGGMEVGMEVVWRWVWWMWRWGMEGYGRAWRDMEGMEGQGRWRAGMRV